jgi:hypothetical protein
MFSGCLQEVIIRRRGQTRSGYPTEPENIGDTVTLHFPTFTETANMAGMSRVLGGYHIQADNVEGLALGRKVAAVAWRPVPEGSVTDAVRRSAFQTGARAAFPVRRSVRGGSSRN